jgi:hypothetical protein
VSSFVRMLSRCESLVKPNKASRGHADDLEHQVAIWLQRIVFPRLSMYTCKNKEVIHRDSEVVCQVIVCKLRRETSAPPRKPRSTTHQKDKKKKKLLYTKRTCLCTGIVYKMQKKIPTRGIEPRPPRT